MTVFTRDHVMQALIGPRGMNAIEGLIAERDEALRKAASAEDYVDKMCPVWAAEDAHTTVVALAQLWELLGVENQTMAVIRLRELLTLREGDPHG